MKNLLFIAGVALLLLFSCNKQAENKDTANFRVESLNERLEVAQDAKDSLIFLMSDIYSGIEEINVQEGLLYNLRGTENAGQREEIIENLTRIKAELADRKARLDVLTKQFNDSNDKNGQLVLEIKQLQSLISQKEKKISDLEAQLKDANIQISNLKDTVNITRQQVEDVTAEKELAENLAEQKSQENAQLINEANKVYYAIGNKKELEQHNILKNKKVMQGNYDLSYFREADKTQLTTIPCYNKKVEILSNHPADSYRIDTGADKIKTIVIINPERFWSTSKFLVVKVG